MKTRSTLSLLAALTVILSGGTALADTCTPTLVAFTDNNAGSNGGYVHFTCTETGTTAHFIMVSPAGCPGIYAHSLDTLRNMMSLLQSALLSGKTIDYGHGTCAAQANDQVTWLGLKRN